MAEGAKYDWRELCVAAAKEEDAEKLTCLVKEIIEAFDQSLLQPRPAGGSQTFSSPSATE
ncbi:MAG: hypothetical protein ABSG70_00125 [Terriglobales bacterium]|jgi:hypothetical protein